jgi:predicted metal-binding membrane protein
VSTAIFAAGYLLVWTAFSALAALGQWALQAVALPSPHTLEVGPGLGGALLMAAGLYQMTPLKYACLSHCCWLLMALLFVAGVMHLGWVAAIAAFVLLEKILPAGRIGPLVTGGALVAWGAVVIARSL